MKPRKIPLGRLVVVHWKDATANRTGWHSFEAVKDYKLICPVTAGFVVHCDQEGITLAQTLSAAFEAAVVAGLWKIPWGDIERIERK